MRFDPGRVIALADSLSGSVAADDFASLLTATGWRVERVSARPTSESEPLHLLASDSSSGSRPARIVLFTRLRGRGRDWSPLDHIKFVTALVLPPAALLMFRLAFLPRWAGWGLVLASWLIALLAIFRSQNGPKEDDRRGLALLAELARVWPGAARGRVETWLVATPDPRDLARELDRRFADGKPTLAIALDHPAVGPELTLAGRGPAAQLVAAVASSLWIPHRSVGRVRRTRGHAGFSSPLIPVLSLCGAEGPHASDAASLSAVEQLITETALRWGKLADSATQTTGPSLARSSQKPG